MVQPFLTFNECLAGDDKTKESADNLQFIMLLCSVCVCRKQNTMLFSLWSFVLIAGALIIDESLMLLILKPLILFEIITEICVPLP